MAWLIVLEGDGPPPSIKPWLRSAQQDPERQVSSAVLQEHEDGSSKVVSTDILATLDEGD